MGEMQFISPWKKVSPTQTHPPKPKPKPRQKKTSKHALRTSTSTDPPQNAPKLQAAFCLRDCFSQWHLMYTDALQSSTPVCVWSTSKKFLHSVSSQERFVCTVHSELVLFSMAFDTHSPKKPFAVRSSSLGGIRSSSPPCKKRSQLPLWVRLFEVYGLRPSGEGQFEWIVKRDPH